jgi:hypothetical protein
MERPAVELHLLLLGEGDGRLLTGGGLAALEAFEGFGEGGPE